MNDTQSFRYTKNHFQNDTCDWVSLQVISFGTFTCGRVNSIFSNAGKPHLERDCHILGKCLFLYKTAGMEFVTIHNLSRELNVPARVIRYRLIQFIAEQKLKAPDDFRRNDYKDDQHNVWKINISCRAFCLREPKHQNQCHRIKDVHPVNNRKVVKCLALVYSGQRLQRMGLR